MQICMLSSEFPPNCAGIGYHVYHLSRRLVTRGHKVVVITRGSWKSKWHREFIEGIEVYRVWYMPTYPFHIKLHTVSVNRLLQQLQIDFDVVHLHSPLVPYVKRLAPYVATQHGTTISDINRRKTRDLYSLGLKVLRYPLIAIDRRISRNASTVLAISRGCGEELRQIYGVCAKKIVVIPNGVDTDFFTPAEKPTIGEPCVLYTGRLDARKGVEDLVPCATYVCREKPKARFVVTGDGPLASDMKRKVHTANLDANFQFTGFVFRGVLLQHYREASVFVLPSYYEGLPTSLLEAMSCGIPSVATDIEGNSEVITDGETGLLVPPRNPRLLAEAILKLLDDEELRSQIGANARKHIVENYDWGLVVDRIEAIYEACLD